MRREMETEKHRGQGQTGRDNMSETENRDTKALGRTGKDSEEKRETRRDRETRPLSSEFISAGQHLV